MTSILIVLDHETFEERDQLTICIAVQNVTSFALGLQCYRYQNGNPLFLFHISSEVSFEAIEM